MPAWDYKVVEGAADLAALGRVGWELVSLVASAEGVPTMYFKRPAPSFRDRVTLDQKRRYYGLLGIPLPETDTP